MADIALNLSKMTIAEKIQLATNVHTALTGNANVPTPTGGDAVKIETTGFSVKATPAPVVVPAQVGNLVLTAGDNERSIDYGHDLVRGAKSYEVQTSVDPVSASSWTDKSAPAGRSLASRAAQRFG